MRAPAGRQMGIFITLIGLISFLDNACTCVRMLAGAGVLGSLVLLLKEYTSALYRKDVWK